MLDLEYKSKIIKKLLVIKEICSWLPPGLDGRKVFSQEHISDHNGMEINTSKTKEMVLGRLASTNLPLLTISSQTI